MQMGQEVKGKFDSSSQMAIEIEVQEGETEAVSGRGAQGGEERQETQIEGVVVGITGDEVTIETERGTRITVRVSDRTRIRLEDSRDELGSLRVGHDVEVKFDSISRIALEIRQED